MANIFNDYFTQIASDIGFNYPIPDDYDNDDVLISLIEKYDKHPSITTIKSVPLEHGTFDFKHVDVNQIYEILVNMNDKKATGYDGIPCKRLQIGAYPLARVLCKLINMSILECRFPDMLKFAEISAFLKKIERLCKDKYRPVSILTAFQRYLKGVILSCCHYILKRYSQNSYRD